MYQSLSREKTRMSKGRKRATKDSLTGKGVDLPDTKLIFQVTRFRVSKRRMDWQDYIAVCAFSVLKDAITWIENQHYPEDFRIDRKHLVRLGDKLHTVNVYPYKVNIDNPDAQDVVMDATGFRASRKQPFKRKDDGQTYQTQRDESVPDGGSGDQRCEVSVDPTDVCHEEGP